MCNGNDYPCFVAADMKTGAGVYKGEPKQGKADCTLTIDDKNMVDMASGKLNGQTVSLRGKRGENSGFVGLVNEFTLFFS